MKTIPSGIQEVGKCSHKTAVNVNDVAQEITLTAGFNTIEIVLGPATTNEVYYGGSGVDSTDGIPLGPGKIWANCKEGFSVYLVCAAGETADVRIAEYRGGE